jgi:hypothetical protein
MADLAPTDRTAITDFLVQKFSLDELKVLAFNLGIDYENFPHDTKPVFSQELYLQCERKSELGCLLTEILKQRADGQMGQLLAIVGGCQPRKKVQIIISENKIASKPDLLASLANLLGVSPDEVALIGAAPGSIYLLVSLPAEAADRLLEMRPATLMDGAYHVQDIAPFEALGFTAQEQWREIAQKGQGGSSGGNTSVKEVVTTGKQSIAVQGQSLLVSGSGAAAGLSAVSVLVVVAILIVAGVGGAALATPKVTVRNNCSTTLPPSGALPLIGSVPSGGAVGPVILPPGTYKVTTTGRDVTLIAPNLAPITFPGVSSRQFSVSRNGQPVSQRELAAGVDVGLGQSYEVVLCGP